VSALRIVVLEYQSRSSSQLLCDFTVEEAASLQEASGNINTETSNLVPRTLLSCTTNSGDQTKSFETQESRRIRGLRLYLSERRNLLKCSEILIRTALDQNQTQAQVGDKGKGKEIRGSLIDRVGASLIKDLSAEDRGYNKFLVACVEAVRVDIGLLNQGSGWFKEEGYRESLELDWLSNQIIQATHTMEILLWVLDAQKLDNPRSSMVVTGWYQFVSSYGFFDDFQPVGLLASLLVSSLTNISEASSNNGAVGISVAVFSCYYLPGSN
jgi:nuclear pore complex protein Nup188